MTVADVVVGLPVPRVFSYAVPPALAGHLAHGQRVRVPFRGRAKVGVVVALAERTADGLEPLDAALDPVPALTGSLLELTRWAAEQTASAWGDAVARALPPSARVTAPVALPAETPRGAPGPLTVGYGAGRARLIEAAVGRAVEAGESALVLAPEIESARGWAARLAPSHGDAIVLVSSAETPRRRWEAWWACREGRRRIVVGTRAAAFVPVIGLGAAVVVDEHDPAHKAPDSPRWHARELAVHRAALEGAHCLLASGTPSLESWARVRAGEATAEEAKGDGWPRVHRADLRRTGTRTWLTAGLRESVRATLAAGGAALLVVNRLGYGEALACAECGATRRCPDCRVALTYHRRVRLLGCRLCGARQAVHSLCPRCRGRQLAPVGCGTERVEAEARAAFAGAAVARYDGTLSQPDAEAVRDAVRSGHVRVVVGTSMALRLFTETRATVAALVLADATLNLPDFRAGEATFQLAWHLAETVGAGGSLWLQSFYPDHPALEAVALGTREVFYEREWAERRELGYPPARRMARLVAAGAHGPALVADLAGRARAAGLTVLGPAALAAGRLQLVLLGDGELPRALVDVLAPLRGRRRVGTARLAVDVDPVEGP